MPLCQKAFGSGFPTHVSISSNHDLIESICILTNCNDANTITISEGHLNQDFNFDVWYTTHHSPLLLCSLFTSLFALVQWGLPTVSAAGVFGIFFSFKNKKEMQKLKL